MGLAPLAGDFYNFQNLLTAEEQEIVVRVRRFFEEKIAPRANDAWAAAEFQFDLLPGFAELDIVKLSHEDRERIGADEIIDRARILLNGDLEIPLGARVKG